MLQRKGYRSFGGNAACLPRLTQPLIDNFSGACSSASTRLLIKLGQATAYSFQSDFEDGFGRNSQVMSLFRRTIVITQFLSQIMLRSCKWQLAYTRVSSFVVAYRQIIPSDISQARNYCRINKLDKYRRIYIFYFIYLKLKCCQP